MKDFWNTNENTRNRAPGEGNVKRGRSSDEAVILPLIALLLSDEKNTELVMALLYILS